MSELDQSKVICPLLDGVKWYHWIDYKKNCYAEKRIISPTEYYAARGIKYEEIQRPYL